MFPKKIVIFTVVLLLSLISLASSNSQSSNLQINSEFNFPVPEVTQENLKTSNNNLDQMAWVQSARLNIGDDLDRRTQAVIVTTVFETYLDEHGKNAFSNPEIKSEAQKVINSYKKQYQAHKNIQSGNYKFSKGVQESIDEASDLVAKELGDALKYIPTDAVGTIGKKLAPRILKVGIKSSARFVEEQYGKHLQLEAQESSKYKVTLDLESLTEYLYHLGQSGRGASDFLDQNLHTLVGNISLNDSFSEIYYGNQKFRTYIDNLGFEEHVKQQLLNGNLKLNQIQQLLNEKARELEAQLKSQSFAVGKSQKDLSFLKQNAEEDINIRVSQDNHNRWLKESRAKVNTFSTLAEMFIKDPKVAESISFVGNFIINLEDLDFNDASIWEYSNLYLAGISTVMKLTSSSSKQNAQKAMMKQLKVIVEQLVELRKLVINGFKNLDNKISLEFEFTQKGFETLLRNQVIAEIERIQILSEIQKASQVIQSHIVRMEINRTSEIYSKCLNYRQIFKNQTPSDEDIENCYVHIMQSKLLPTTSDPKNYDLSLLPIDTLTAAATSSTALQLSPYLQTALDNFEIANKAHNKDILLPNISLQDFMFHTQALLELHKQNPSWMVRNASASKFQELISMNQKYEKSLSQLFYNNGITNHSYVGDIIDQINSEALAYYSAVESDIQRKVNQGNVSHRSVPYDFNPLKKLTQPFQLEKNKAHLFSTWPDTIKLCPGAAYFESFDSEYLKQINASANWKLQDFNSLNLNFPKTTAYNMQIPAEFLWSQIMGFGNIRFCVSKYGIENTTKGRRHCKNCYGDYNGFNLDVSIDAWFDVNPNFKGSLAQRGHNIPTSLLIKRKHFNRRYTLGSGFNAKNENGHDFNYGAAGKVHIHSIISSFAKNSWNGDKAGTTKCSKNRWTDQACHFQWRSVKNFFMQDSVVNTDPKVQKQMKDSRAIVNSLFQTASNEIFLSTAEAAIVSPSIQTLTLQKKLDGSYKSFQLINLMALGEEYSKIYSKVFKGPNRLLSLEDINNYIILPAETKAQIPLEKVLKDNQFKIQEVYSMLLNPPSMATDNILLKQIISRRSDLMSIKNQIESPQKSFLDHLSDPKTWWEGLKNSVGIH